MKFFLQIKPVMRTMARSLFCLALLVGQLPVKLVAQFCPNGVTVAQGDFLNNNRRVYCFSGEQRIEKAGD